MSQPRWAKHFWIRNGVALLGLMLATYLPDMYALELRSGWSKLTPYLFLGLLYCWLVFHNRILFERLFEQNKRREYVGWLLLFMVVGSLGLSLSLHYLYNRAWPVPLLVKYYIFTLTGLGVYKLYRQASASTDSQANASKDLSALANERLFRILVDGNWQDVLPNDIIYVESLENYVRIVTRQTSLVSRLTMKQTEEQLPNYFLRISRSRFINTRHVLSQRGDELLVDTYRLRIGRTYKQHVVDRLRSQAARSDEPMMRA
jgi:hypothetical protein